MREWCWGALSLIKGGSLLEVHSDACSPRLFRISVSTPVSSDCSVDQSKGRDWKTKGKRLKNQPHLEILHYLPPSVGHGPTASAPPKKSRTSGPSPHLQNQQDPQATSMPMEVWEVVVPKRQLSSCNPFAIPLFLLLPWKMGLPQREEHQSLGRFFTWEFKHLFSHCSGTVVTCSIGKALPRGHHVEP